MPSIAITRRDGELEDRVVVETDSTKAFDVRILHPHEMTDYAYDREAAGSAPATGVEPSPQLAVIDANETAIERPEWACTC